MPTPRLRLCFVPLSVCVNVLPSFDRSVHLSVTHPMDAILFFTHTHTHTFMNRAVAPFCIAVPLIFVLEKIKVSDFLV